MRSNWRGVISFGLVSIPIVLYPSENKSSIISFHQIDKRDNARIRYQRINETTGKSVPWEEITRGYEYDKDTVIPVPDNILKHVAGDNARNIGIEKFINKNDLDFFTIENVYYLVPDKNGEKGYVILRESLLQTKKIGIAKVIISTKEYLAAILPHEKALMLCLLKYDNEMRKPSDFDLPVKQLKAYKINRKEIDVAKQLIMAMTSKWDPKKYVDEYQKAIHQWVNESAQHLPHTVMKQRTQASADVVNFVDLLRKSLRTSPTHHGSKTKRPPKAKAKRERHVTRH